jgi:hypothetical protein
VVARWNDRNMNQAHLSNVWREVRDGAGLSKVCGLIGVVHVPSGKLLVVASTDVGRQLHLQRCCLLGRRPHCNPGLARDLAADGPGAFKTYLLRECEEPRLLPLLKLIEVEKAGSLAYNAKPALRKRRPGAGGVPRRGPQSTPTAPPRLHPVLRRDPAAAMGRILERVERLELTSPAAAADVTSVLDRAAEALERLNSSQQAVEQGR